MQSLFFRIKSACSFLLRWLFFGRSRKLQTTHRKKIDSQLIFQIRKYTWKCNLDWMWFVRKWSYQQIQTSTYLYKKCHRFRMILFWLLHFKSNDQANGTYIGTFFTCSALKNLRKWCSNGSGQKWPVIKVAMKMLVSPRAKLSPVWAQKEISFSLEAFYVSLWP